DNTESQSMASQTSPSSPVAQPSTSGGAVATPAAGVADTSNQSASHGKRPTEKQRQRKEAEARLIEQYAAELRAAQMKAREARIQELLTAAKNEYDAGAIWQPAGASAADRYR